MRAALVLLAAILGAPVCAGAHGWGLLYPAESTGASVRARYGAPTRILKHRLQSHDTEEWVYEGKEAPPGFLRLAVYVGYLKGEEFLPAVVRGFTLEPKPGIFTRELVLQGWGPPTRVDFFDGKPGYDYDGGLIVLFDIQGTVAQTMIFSPPRTEASAR
jgi:hypothetical protein